MLISLHCLMGFLDVNPEILVSYFITTRRYNPENDILNLHRHNNLKSLVKIPIQGYLLGFPSPEQQHGSLKQGYPTTSLHGAIIRNTTILCLHRREKFNFAPRFRYSS